MKDSVKKKLQMLLLVALTAFGLWFALKDDMQSVLNNIKSLSFGWLCIISIIGILYYVLQGYVLYEATLKYQSDAKKKDGVVSAYIAAFFNGITPLGGGQVALTYSLMKRGLSFSHAVSVLWCDFFMYQSVVIVLSFLIIVSTLSQSFQQFGAYTWLILLGFLINSFVIVMLWTMSHFPKLYQRLSQFAVELLYRIKIVKHREKTLGKWNESLHIFTNEIQALKENRPFIVKAAILNTFRMLLYYAIPYVVAVALGMPLNLDVFMHMIVLSCYIHMLNALTPLPGDTGWTEAVFILLFCSIVDRSDAASIMILWRFATYYLQIFIGGIVFLIEKPKLDEVQKMASKTAVIKKMPDEIVE